MPTGNPTFDPTRLRIAQEGTSFEDFISQAWNDHATQAEEVASRLPDGVSQIEKLEQVSPLAQLITHVMGEHLGRWSDGVELLQALSKSQVELADQSPADASESARAAISRSIATLELASNRISELAGFSAPEQVRVLASAAAALIGQKDSARAQAYFRQAVELASSCLSKQKQDPANRALAVTANNLASELEQLKGRTAQEVELMIFAARTARRYWEIAGTWREVERAEYRLALTYLAAGNSAAGALHAGLCLEICRANSAPALELFFAHEALARSALASGDEERRAKAITEMKASFGELSTEDQEWCHKSFEPLE